MRLRPALAWLCAVVALSGTAPLTAAATPGDDIASLTLVLTADGAPGQRFDADDVPVGQGPELVGQGAGTCEQEAVVDIDPVARTITVAVPDAGTATDVELTVLSDMIGGAVPVSPALADSSAALTVTVTPELLWLTWRATPAGPGCGLTTAVFAYVGPGESLPPGAELAPVESGTGLVTGADPATAVVAAPTFAG